MRIFITGTSGFIGFSLARRLLADGHQVLGYDAGLPDIGSGLGPKRLALLVAEPGFRSVTARLEDRVSLDAAMSGFAPDIIVHLAAQAGVRHSMEHPDIFVSSNVLGTEALLEISRAAKPRHLLMASTSSVYGGNPSVPFREVDRTDFPVSLYAATKKAGEALSHSNAHLYDVPTTCFRFFTVYGPWGRPDMAPYKFVDAIANGRAIDVYGHGDMRRDFTFIDDLVEAIVRLVEVPPRVGTPVVAEGVEDSLSPVAPWRTVNIGAGTPVGLLEFIEAIERHLERPAVRTMLPMQPGDVAQTHADVGLLRALTGYVPGTSVDEGVRALVEWYRAATKG